MASESATSGFAFGIRVLLVLVLMTLNFTIVGDAWRIIDDGGNS